MRTNIVIDDALMRQAMQTSGARSKREAVELGLCTLVRLQEPGGDPLLPRQALLGG
ncbi:type II toxin-antitoxin system VapB family antitoxin [Vulcanococcus limneticus]|jgi:Arc/MetJ family transcription regulator|uniref:type II toxin-antitoxin system VapB family antitoxin n=1 Tax=Vulcanococcus limneticus TaxID=2170428 RepID=UPI00398BDAA2